MNVPIRIRLTAWYSVLLASVILALGTFLALQFRSDLLAATEHEAQADSAMIIRGFTDGINEKATTDPEALADDAKHFDEEVREILPQAGGAAQLLSSDGRVVAKHGSIAGEVPLVSAAARDEALAGKPGTFTEHFGGQRYVVTVTAFPHHDAISVLLVALSLQKADDAVQQVLMLLLIAAPAALVLTTLAAYWLARKALRPVERMTSDAREIGTVRLHERIAVPAVRDEIWRLAVTLNAMLDRIERGMNEQRWLVADASHELRTPLAVMRAEIDVSLRADELSPAARAVLVSTREEVDRLRRTVDNLLALAEAEEGRLQLLTVRVGLLQAIEDAARPLQPLAAAKGVTLTIEGGRWDAQADPQRLHLALTNLTENAIKFTPSGGAVRIVSWHRDGEVGVTVFDDGPGIPADVREHLFDRFYRLESARGGRVAGSGLGLAICREVALAHGGRVWVESGTGRGSAFSIALPSWRALHTDEQPPDPGEEARGEYHVSTGRHGK